MTVFKPTHKLVAPAGEEIPVMLVSQKESLRYLVVSAEEYEEGSSAIYEWHPAEGVTYSGYKLDGLEIVALECLQPLQYSALAQQQRGAIRASR